MKKIFLLFIVAVFAFLFALGMQNVYGATLDSETRLQISKIQQPSRVNVDTSSIPSLSGAKGFIGEVLSKLFHDSGVLLGKIRNEFIAAFNGLSDGSINYIVKWSGEGLVPSKIIDDDSGIRINAPVMVNGDVQSLRNFISRPPILSNHLATKAYVDTIQNSIPTCNGENKALGWNGSTWVCNTISGGSDTGTNPNDLVFGTHQVDDCTSEGGTVYNEGAVKFCRFPGASCPASWTKYQQWSTTISRACSSAYGLTCTTGRHSWGNQSNESCSYTQCTDVGKGCRSSICRAGQTEVGCY